MSNVNPLGTTKQFVYAQQDILGGTKRTNDLVVVNDADYRDSGICVGPGGPYNNMRLAYSVSDGAGSITTDKLNVNVEQLYFNNLPSAQNINKSCNYVVADNSGNVKEGYPMFRGDINQEVNTIKDDIILIKQSLGLPVVQPVTIDMILSYVAIVLCIIFLIILIILLFRIHKLNKKLTEAEERIEEMKEMMGARQLVPKPEPPPQQFPSYYPYYYPPQANLQSPLSFQPQAQLPQVSLPPAQLPPVSLPPAQLPQVGLPPAQLPQVSLPPAQLPQVSLPPAQLPPVGLPPAQLPQVSLPQAQLPQVSLPPAQLPQVSLPPAQLPQVSLPPATISPTSVLPQPEVSSLPPVSKIQALAQIQQSLSRESK
jgi:hypothetical protein